MKPWEKYRKLKAAREAGDESTFFELWNLLKEDELARQDGTLGNVLLLEAQRMSKTWRLDHDAGLEKLISLLEGFRNYFSMDPADCKWYSQGLRLALKIRERYPQFLDFVAWWGLEHLSEEDYTPYVNPQGKEIMAVAEQAYLAVGQALDEKEPFDTAEVEIFLEKLQAVSRVHPEYSWLDFIGAKLLLRLDRPEEALVKLRPFVRRKPKEYWAWATLASAANRSGEKEAAVACYVQAISLQKREDSLMNVREHLGQLWLELGQYDAGRTELDLAAQARMRFGGGRIPESLRLSMESQAYQQGRSGPNNWGRYRRIRPLARIFSVGDLPSIWGLLLHVKTLDDPRKQRLVIQTGEDTVHGYPITLLLDEAEDGDWLEIWLDPATERAALIASGVPEQMPEWVREAQGTLVRHAKGFGFVEDLFIPPFMITNLPTTLGLKVDVRATWSFDQKRNEWKWKVVRVRPME